MERQPHEGIRDTDIHTLTRTLLGAPPGGLLDETFHRMEVAEDEIAAAEARSPEHAEKLHRGFSVLCPSEPLRGTGKKLYRAHCRELLERVREGHDTRTATSAEVIAVLSALSLHAPLDRPATFLYWQLFSALFPTEATELRATIGPVAADSYDQTCATELESKLRRSLLVSTRQSAPSPARSKAA